MSVPCRHQLTQSMNHSSWERSISRLWSFLRKAESHGHQSVWVSMFASCDVRGYAVTLTFWWSHPLLDLIFSKIELWFPQLSLSFINNGFFKLCHPHTCTNLIGLARDDVKAFITHRVPTQRSDSIHKNQFDAFAGCRGFDGITCNFNGGITCPLLTAFCVWVVERICRTWPKRYLITSQTKVKRVTLAGYTTRQSSSS